MPEHTPGPWEVDFSGVQVNSQNKAVALAAINDKTNGYEAFANAKLIAAAPEMHEALVAFVEYYDSLDMDLTDFIDLNLPDAREKISAWMPLLESIREAIRKARQ